MTWRIVQYLLVLTLVLAQPSHALIACGAVAKGTTQLKDGASIKLRTTCKTKERAIDLFALVLAGPTTCSAQDVTDGQGLQQTAQARFQAGSATIADVQLSSVLAVEVQFCAGQTTQADYCAAVVPPLVSLVSARTTQHQTGFATIDQVVAARRDLLEKRAFCGTT
jgi:hypothetical protein